MSLGMSLWSLWCPVVLGLEQELEACWPAKAMPSYYDCRDPDVCKQDNVCRQVGVGLGLILVPNGKHFGKMLGDQYSHYEPQSV